MKNMISSSDPCFQFQNPGYDNDWLSQEDVEQVPIPLEAESDQVDSSKHGLSTIMKVALAILVVASLVLPWPWEWSCPRTTTAAMAIT
jgi:hypothetical protein